MNLLKKITCCIIPLDIKKVELEIDSMIVPNLNQPTVVPDDFVEYQCNIVSDDFIEYQCSIVPDPVK